MCTAIRSSREIWGDQLKKKKKKDNNELDSTISLLQCW